MSQCVTDCCLGGGCVGDDANTSSHSSLSWSPQRPEACALLPGWLGSCSLPVALGCSWRSCTGKTSLWMHPGHGSSGQSASGSVPCVCTRAHARTRMHTHAHACTHAYTHTHLPHHTRFCVSDCVSDCAPLAPSPHTLAYNTTKMQRAYTIRHSPFNSLIGSAQSLRDFQRSPESPPLHRLAPPDWRCCSTHIITRQGMWGESTHGTAWWVNTQRVAVHLAH